MVGAARRAAHAGNRRLDALVRIRDHQPDAGAPPALGPAQELEPEGLGLRRAERHAAHLTAAGAVERDGDGHRDRDDAAGFAHLHVGGIDPQIGPLPGRSGLGAPLPNPTGQSLDRPLEEGQPGK